MTGPARTLPANILTRVLIRIGFHRSWGLAIHFRVRGSHVRDRGRPAVVSLDYLGVL
jgi:hypothetical protein